MSEEHEGEAQQEETPPLRDLPGELYNLAIGEWRSRTRWGKITYPIWFLLGAFQWTIVLSLLAVVWAWNVYSKAVDEAAAGLKRVTPDVYKEDRGERDG